MLNRKSAANPPLRILILGNIPPYRIGGAEVQSRRLAEAFARQGHQVTIAGYAIPKGSFHTDPPEGPVLTTVHLATLRGNRLSRAVSYSAALSSFLIRHRMRFDAIYTRMLGESALVAAALKSLKLLPMPLVVSSACAGAYGDARFLERMPATKMLVVLLNRGCDAVNILSPAIARELERLGIRRRKFTYIPNGIPIRDGPPRTFSDHPGRRSLLFVGRLTPQKGIGDLLQAVSLLRRKGIPAFLHVVGEGPLRTSLQRLAGELNIGDAVRFWGAVGSNAVDRFHAIGDVFVLPSHCEGQPNAMLEAMGSGLPVLVTACGAENMVTSDFGRVVPVGDPRSLAHHIEQMWCMSGEQLARMGLKAREYAQSRYDIQAAADRYIDLFRMLIGIGRVPVKYSH